MEYYIIIFMSSRDFPSSEGVEMVLQGGVARLGPPVGGVMGRCKRPVTRVI